MRHRRSQVAWIAVVLLAGLTLVARAQDESSNAPAGNPSDSLLSHNVVVPLKVVKEFFPTLARQHSDVNSAAVGKPMATRMEIYSSRDGLQNVTLTVDQYKAGSEALVAYQEALQKSQSPEFNPISISNIGQQVFAGTVTRGSETRTTVTSLDGALIVGATLTGFDASTDNIGKLGELARREVAEAHAHARAPRKR